MEIEIVTLACAGDCAQIQAVARGGNPPYTFAWDDGSTDPRRKVCLDASTFVAGDTIDFVVGAAGGLFICPDVTALHATVCKQ